MKVDPYINKYVLAKVLGIKPNTAGNKISTINKAIALENYNTIAGWVPASEVERYFKVKRDTIIYWWEKLGYADINQDGAN